MTKYLMIKCLLYKFADIIGIFNILIF